MARTSTAIIAALGLVLSATAARAQDTAATELKGEHVRVSWLSPERFGDGPETVGVRFTPEPGWHVYWQNPGDSGAAPRFVSSGNATVGPVQWPYPTRLPVAHLVNLGYPGDAALLVPVTPGADERVKLSLKLEWLVCREDECVPGFGTLTLDRPRGAEPTWSADTRALRDSFLQRVPKTMPLAPWRVTNASVSPDRVSVALEAQGSGATTSPDAFPLDGAFLASRAPDLEKTANGFVLHFARNPGAQAPPTTGFVFVANDQAWQANDVTLSAATTSTSAPSEPLLPLWLLLASAFLGGLILNLMPCVLPVLSIKFLTLAQTERGSRLREALLYTAGVVTTFLLLGGAVIALQAAGTAVGWGFQLQSPVVVLALASLFWLMALNFLGVFDLGFLVMSVAGRSRASSAFATGALSVFIAAPCTGPFMGTALGATATLPALPALAIFLALGLGLASPFVILALVPALLDRLPKPGAWMETLKQLFAFPLFATVLWLLWVLGMQLGTQGWLVASSVLLILAFALWLGRASKHRVGVVLAWVVALTGLGGGARTLAQTPSVTEKSTSSAFAPYDPQALAQARNTGKPVFVDFTASWCITCQVNKQAVLETEDALALFAKHEVTLFAADWTTRDATITQALAAFGRNSVPLYVYYPPNGEPRILPQVLTLSTLKELF